MEEIRAEKLAKTRSTSKQDATVEANASPPPATKRSAQQNNRHIKIKRPKLTSDVTTTSRVQPTVQVKPPVTVVKKLEPEPVIKAAKPEDDSLVEEEYFVEEEEDDGTGTPGAEALNDDELLLEIDNILGN